MDAATGHDVMASRDLHRLTPGAVLEAARCLDSALKARLSKLENNNNATSINKSHSRSASTDHADKKIVHVRVLFMKINNIDTIKDNYSAEIILQSKWREPRLDTRFKDPELDDEIEWDKYWNPKILIDNVFGDPNDKAHMSVIRDYKTGQATVCETRCIKGRFFELMELYKFPFDVQRLTVVLLSELDGSQLKLCSDAADPSGVNVSAFSAEQEWRLGQDVRTWNSSKVKINNGQKWRYPMFSVAVRVSRRPQFFIWNIITMMFLTCSLSFATFTCNLASPQFRLQLTFLLLLTTVTFKFAVNKLLPKIPYLTFLDKYILGSLIIQFCVCIWHAVVGSVIQQNTMPVSASATGNNYTCSYMNMTTTTVAPSSQPKPTDLATVADYIALGALGGFYIVFQIVFLALIGTNTQKFVEEKDTDDDEDGN